MKKKRKVYKETISKDLKYSEVTTVCMRIEAVELAPSNIFF